MLIEPALQASQADAVYAHRVGKVAALHTLAERLAEGHHLRHQVQWARREGDFAQAATRLDAARIYTDAIMGWFYELAERNQGLIDKNEVPSFIKMGVKNWLDTEAKAIVVKDTRVNEAELLKDPDGDESSPKQSEP